MLGKGIGLLALLIIVASITPAFALTELERASIGDPKLVNAFGAPIGNKINVDQQIQIASDITNNQEESQKFTYLVQVKDSEDIVVKVAWFSGELNPYQKWNTSVFWVPEYAGEFTAEIFVWEGFPVNHKALTEYSSIQISVS
ncbi:MAG: hypothetical protein ACE5RC_05005 [Nitrosopumilus sp.]